MAHSKWPRDMSSKVMQKKRLALYERKMKHMTSDSYCRFKNLSLLIRIIEGEILTAIKQFAVTLNLLKIEDL